MTGTPASGRCTLKLRPPALAIQMGSERPPAAQQPSQLVAQVPNGRERFPSVAVEQRPIARELLLRGQGAVLAERRGPDVAGPARRTVPAQDARRILLQQ